MGRQEGGNKRREEEGECGIKELGIRERRRGVGGLGRSGNQEEEEK